MWTTKNRGRYDRCKLRYPGDLTDEEWTHIEPVIPPAKVGGNRRRVNVREVGNGIMYILSTGCQWRAIPKDLPPRSTLFDYLDSWSSRIPSFVGLPRNKRIKTGGKPFRKESEGAYKMGTSVRCAGKR